MLDESALQFSRPPAQHLDRADLQNFAASWNPENLDQSTIQILRDPGWLLKWIGSLPVVVGFFIMFYLQPYRKQTEGEPILPAAKPEQNPREMLVAAER